MKLLVFLLLPCLSLSEVSPGFDKCKDFFLNFDPPQFTPPPPPTPPTPPTPPPPPPPWDTTVQYICQCVWDDDDQQTFLYATLYSTTWRIPIYSAYVFYGSISVGRDNPWYIEPQLDDPIAEPCMAPKGRLKNIGNNQAVNSDYKGQDLNKPSYDRGHLYPVQHTDDPLSMLATSTLTNTAPQDACFNRLQWYNHEKNVIKDLKDCKSEAYVVTGVVPDHTKPKLKNRVTVSKYYWRATCCVKKNSLDELVYIGKGYFGPDNNNVVQQLSITALQTQLAKNYKVNNVIIFPSLPTPAGPKKPRTGGCI